MVINMIHVLSKETIDKIAAGEVVERPSSVVKELMENAVDAKASAITVEIKEGGISFIRVTDNGSGIGKEEVPKAFLRHATSKIQSAEDLSRIESLGFRGEALSSIAAVSRMELITKTSNSLTGVRYLIEGGEEKETEEIGAPEGTTILVRNLFFNTPVRKKFLKQPQTEGGYISDLMEHMAMSHPGISFQYINNGQIRFHTSGNGKLQEIIYRIYGKDISNSLIPVDAEENGIHMYGYLGKPEVNRANRNFEVYFVNGRFIKSGIISRGIEEGYNKYMMQHKFPFAVLHFQIDSQEIDVNVHPTKMEVRFTNQQRLHDFIAGQIQTSIHRIELIPQVVLEPSKEAPKEKLKAGTVPEPFEMRRAGHRQLKAVAEEIPYLKEKDSFFVENRSLSRQEEKEKPIIQEPIINKTAIENPQQINFFEEKLLTKESRSEYEIMGQIFDTYWLVAFRDKLFMIDQHAAHEKVKFESLMKQLESNQINSQILSPPVIITLSGREESILREYQSVFDEMGFETESFGGNEYTIRCVPADLYGCSENELFKDILDELAEGSVKGAPKVIRHRIAAMACKAAVKGNMKFNRPGIEALIDQLLSLEDPYHCPHGRPTIISMSKYEIEKKFKRIV